MRQTFAAALLIAVFAGLSVMWCPDRWAVGVAQCAIFGVGSAWTCCVLIARCALPAGFAHIPLLGILFWGGVQLALGWTVYPWQTCETMLYWFTNLLALTVASSLSQDTETAHFLRKWLFAGGVALSFLAVLQNFTSDGLVFWHFKAQYTEDLWGPFLYRNQYAAFIELLLPIAWVSALLDENKRWPYLVVTAGLFSCVVASASRAGLILAAAEILVISAILLSRRELSLTVLGKALVPLLLLATIFAAVVGPETVWARLQQHDPYSERGQWTVASLSMMRDRPIKGFGLGTWPLVYPAYAATDDGVFVNQAHNDWAQAGVEGGLPVFLCFAAFFLWTVRTGWRTPWALGLSFVLVHAVVDYPIQRQALGAFFFLFAGVSSQLRRRSREQLSSTLAK
ncbi:MAG: O-antigen ligase family protein [Candidatus Solibacter sp.]